MAINYGRNYRKITLSDISSISIVNSTNTSAIDDENGAVLQFSHSSSVGCGSSGFTILLKDTTPWTRITYKIYLTGTTSCWAFSQGTSYVPADANILVWDSSQDRVFFSKNCWELPQYTLKMSACDNNSDNFFHGSYATGTYREFYTTRRRNSTASLAGLSCGRACMGDGTTIISNIRVW